MCRRGWGGGSVARTWHDRLLAGGALGRVVVGVALCAQHQIILGGEGLLHQGSAALAAREAFLVPVTVLVGQVLVGSIDS